jgi:hypothetical protein
MIYTLCRLVCKDISNGLERIPVPASNTVDDPPLPPVGKCISNPFRKFSCTSSRLHHIAILPWDFWNTLYAILTFLNPVRVPLNYASSQSWFDTEVLACPRYLMWSIRDSLLACSNMQFHLGNLCCCNRLHLLGRNNRTKRYQQTCTR